MYYVYVLESAVDRLWYTGCTKDLKKRFELHNKGLVKSTKKRRPLKLIYYEACISETDAFRREKYLKSTYGKRYLRSRLSDYFTG